MVSSAQKRNRHSDALSTDRATRNRATSWHSGFKAALFGLLALNAVLFARAGTASEALDSIAWFVLLVLFEAETRAGAYLQRPGVRVTVRSVRLLAAIAVGAAAVGYVYDAAWLDAINAWLWIAVVALLELGIRRPHVVSAHRIAFAAGAALLYAALAAVVLSWAWQGVWFDAYDALLWLVAFAMIEVNVLERARHAASARHSRERAAELRDEV